MPDAPNLVAEPTSTLQRMQPTYDEGSFKITKPLANKSLPVRQEYVDKWMHPGVPVALQDQFKARVHAHNAKLNPEGKAWSATTTTKRPAAQPAEGADATEVQPPADGPKSIEDVMKLHDNKAERKDDADGVFTHIVATDGSYYIFANKDGVAGLEVPLLTYAGDYMVGVAYDASIKDGADLFEWQMSSDTYEASCMTDPVYAKGYSSKPTLLHEFLHYLEEQGKVNVDIECHKVARKKTLAASADRATYTISPQEKCGFRSKSQQSHSSIVGPVTATIVKDSQYVKFIMRLKFVAAQMTIQPSRPCLFLKKALRFRQGVLLKLAGP